MMLMTTALHLVPDPDDEPSAPEAGEQPALAPVPADHPDPGGTEAPGEEDDQPDDEDTDDQEEDGDDEEEVPAPRALALPDLSPYTDTSWIPRVINAGIEGARRYRAAAPDRKAKRAAAKAARREVDKAVNKEMRGRLLAVAVDVASGSLHVLGHIGAWLRGEYGPKSVKGGGRFGLAAFLAYCTFRAVGTWPQYAPIGLVLLWVAAALGAAHRRRAEESKKKGDGKAPAKVEKKAGPPPADTPDEDSADDPEETPEEGPDEGPPEAPAGPPPPPSREVIARALHDLYSGGSGVLLTTLRQHLSQPSTRAVREVLQQAGIRVRSGVRTPDGNGPGVHRHDFPPRPPHQEAPQGVDVCAGQTANNNNANAERGPREGLRADGSYWPPGKPYHFEPDAENPHRTLIVKHQDPD